MRSRQNKSSLSAILSSFVLTFLVMISCSNQVKAQYDNMDPDDRGLFNGDTTIRNNAVYSYPLAFISSSMKMGFEGKIGRKKGLKVFVSYAATDNSDIRSAREFVEYGVELQPRFYINRVNAALFGFFTAPFVRYLSASFLDSDPRYNTRLRANALTIGYILGYQRVFPSTFSIEFFAGGGINNPSSTAGTEYLKKDQSPWNMYKRGILPVVGIGIGLAF